MTSRPTASLPAVVRCRPIGLHYPILAETMLCVVPALALVAVGRIRPAALVLYAGVLLFLAYHFVRREFVQCTTLVIGATPALMLLRGYFYYSALPAIYIYTSLVFCVYRHADSERFKKNRVATAFAAGCVCYWLATVIATGTYSVNIRVLECAFAAVNVYLLTARRSYLATALVGIAASVTAVGIALLPYGPRLGEGAIDSDTSIGNPITLGLGAALVVLLSIADGGRWMLLHRRPILRAFVNGTAGVFLILSTSRGSWLVTTISVLLILLLNRRARKPLLISAGVAALILVALLQTDRGPTVRHYFTQAVSDEKSLDKRTTGRANQWQSFPRLFNDSPLWGFGPGSGKEVSLRYTREGKPWHSLYLHVGAELGLLGLTAIALLISALLYKGVAHHHRSGELTPLMCAVAFMFIGVSVTGLDSMSGVFVGLALQAAELPGWRSVRGVRLSGSALRRDGLVVAQ